MPRPPPPEIVDLIIDHLRDEQSTLRTCCVVSKTWVPRTRKHIFYRVELISSHIELWKKTFPDPSNSPAHYARSLTICGLPVIPAADPDAGGWIRAFRNLVHLHLEHAPWVDYEVSLTPFHGLSPTVRSLRLADIPSEVFDLVCSFPLLEDLALRTLRPAGGAVGRCVPLTSPKLTGSLDLITFREAQYVTRRLLDLPGGLHFATITVLSLDENLKLTNDLVSRCSGTLESLTICYSFMRSPSVPSIDLSRATKLKHLTFRCRRSSAQRVVVSLQTVGSKNLQQITIHPHPTALTGTEVRQEWQNLDHLLVRFWTSHSIRPRILYKGGRETRDHASSMLPELTRRGLVDLVDHDIIPMGDWP